MRVPRTRGATLGPLLIIFGLWAALIPFVGPYFDYGFGADTTWVWHTSRLWMNVLPGAAAVLAGLVLSGLAERITMSFAAWLACATGAWLVVAPILTPLWNNGTSLTGTPLGDTTQQSLEYLGFYHGLGAVILFLGATAFGRLSVVALRDRPLRPAAEPATAAPTATESTTPGRPGAPVVPEAGSTPHGHVA